MRCKNKVAQILPSGHGYREIESPCGSTGIHGQQLICDECQSRYEKMYPQGWKYTPGDVCKHGTYIGSASDADYMCGECESL